MVRLISQSGTYRLRSSTIVLSTRQYYGVVSNYCAAAAPKRAVAPDNADVADTYDVTAEWERTSGTTAFVANAEDRVREDGALARNGFQQECAEMPCAVERDAGKLPLLHDSRAQLERGLRVFLKPATRRYQMLQECQDRLRGRVDLCLRISIAMNSHCRKQIVSLLPHPDALVERHRKCMEAQGPSPCVPLSLLADGASHGACNPFKDHDLLTNREPSTASRTTADYGDDSAAAGCTCSEESVPHLSLALRVLPGTPRRDDKVRRPAMGGRGSAGGGTTCAPGRGNVTFDANMAGSSSAAGLDDFWEVAPSSLGQLQRWYRKQALRAHPDKGGSRESWNALEERYDSLRNWVEQKETDEQVTQMEAEARRRAQETFWEGVWSKVHEAKSSAQASTSAEKEGGHKKDRKKGRKKGVKVHLFG